MLVRRDEGYAWIVAAAGAVVIFSGPSSYSSSGLFFSKINLNTAQRIWIPQITYIVWLITALLAGPLSSLYTHRRIAAISCFVAAGGLAVTAVTLDHPDFNVLSYSITVGTGLGLAFHTTFLLVSTHFRKHRGFATGIGIFSAGIGQAVAAVICSPSMLSKNNFFIRALMTSVAFMSASLYISSNASVRDKFPPMPVEDEIKCEPAVVQNGDNPAKYSEVTIIQEIRKPLQPNNMINLKPNANCNASNIQPDLLKTKKAQSKLLSSVTSNLLPNISEESEHSPFLQTKEFKRPPMSSSSNFERSPKGKIKKVNMELANKFCIQPIDAELEKRIAKTIENNKSREPRPRAALRGLFQGQKEVMPFSSSLALEISPIVQSPLDLSPNLWDDTKPHHGIEIEPLPPDLIAKIVRQQKKCSTLSNAGAKNANLTQTSMPKPSGNTIEIPHSGRREYVPFWREILDRIDLDFLTDLRFLNMCIPGTLCIICLQNFPLFCSSYINAVLVSNHARQNLSLVDLNLKNSGIHTITKETEEGLTIIFALDMATRLGMSYLSDLPCFNRRWGFLVASFGSAIICLVLSMIEDLMTIFVLCGLFGVFFGTMMVTESLMLVEVFGIKKLPSCYGLMNVIKVIFVLLLCPTQIPSSIFTYNFHPLKSMQRFNGNGTSVTEITSSFDPLGLFVSTEQPELALAVSKYWLQVLCIPGFILAFLWTIELSYEHRRHGFFRFRTYSTRKDSNSTGLHQLRRTNSNPLH